MHVLECSTGVKGTWGMSGTFRSLKGVASSFSGVSIGLRELQRFSEELVGDSRRLFERFRGYQGASGAFGRLQLRSWASQGASKSFRGVASSFSGVSISLRNVSGGFEGVSEGLREFQKFSI